MEADAAYKALGVSRDDFVDELRRVVTNINLFGYALTIAGLIADEVAVDVCEYANLDKRGFRDKSLNLSASSLNLSAARVILKAVGGDVPKPGEQRRDD